MNDIVELHSKRSVSVLLLCGLPASGKSTLARFLRNQKCILGYSHVVHVEYDDIADKERNENSSNQQESNHIEETFTLESLEAWRSSRNVALQQLDKELDLFLQDDDETMSLLVIMDDNFHLRSMRRNVYRVCQKYCTKKGTVLYSSIWVEAPLETCRKRNSQRTGSRCIPDAVLDNLYHTMEPPDPLKACWEKCCLQWKSTAWDPETKNNDATTILKQIQEVLSCARLHPVQPPMTTPQVNLELLRQERQATLESRLHSYDKLLRTWVSEVARLQKSRASHANATRKKILQNLRNALLTEPPQVMEWFLDAMENTWDEFNQTKLRNALRKSLQNFSLDTTTESQHIEL